MSKFVVDPMISFKEFAQAPMCEYEGFLSVKVIDIKCRSDDSFSSLMARILKDLLPGSEEFSEDTASLLATSFDGLILCFKDSHCLRGSVFETLLEYFRPFVAGNLVVFVVDSPVVIERLIAQVQFAGRFLRPEVRLGGLGPVISAEVLFKAFIEHLNKASYQHCLLAPQVCELLCGVVSASSIPLINTIKTLRYIAFSTLQHSPLITTECFDEPGIASRLQREGISSSALAAAMKKRSPRQYLDNNAALLQALIGLRGGHEKSRYEWIMAILSGPNFIANLALEPFFTALEKQTPDEAVQYLKRLESRLREFPLSDVAEALKSSVCPLADGAIRSRSDISKISKALKCVIADAELLHIGHPLAPWLIYSDASGLDALFFADVAKKTLLALKSPEKYLRRYSKATTAPAFKRVRANNQITPPDACRVYRLTLEWQRQVNLHDLYLQFQSQVHTRKGKVTAEMQKQYLARFQQAVGELHLAGIWAPMGRRRDTYERRNLCDSLADGYL